MKTTFFLSAGAILLACSMNTPNTEDPKRQNTMEESKPKPKKTPFKLKNYVGYPILSYNVENLFDTKNDSNDDEEFTPDGANKWTEERYLKKLEKLADAISSFDEKLPIIVGLGEVENAGVVAALMKTGKLKGAKYNYIHYDSPDKRGIDCAILYDTERVKVLDQKKLTVKLANDVDFVTRDVVYLKGELMNNKIIHVFANHWPSRREGEKESEPKRLVAAKTVRDAINEILKKDKNANIIVMGDLNDHPDNKSVHEILKAVPTNELKTEDQMVNLFWEAHANNEGTHVHDKQWDVLDHLIVSYGFYKDASGLGIEKNEGHIGKIEKLLFTYDNGSQKPSSTYGGPKYYGGYSDHLPVYLILK
jgi:predicted extracellular nuclease